jgi:hypothetical protein
MPEAVVARRQQHVEQTRMLILEFQSMLGLLFDRYYRICSSSASEQYKTACHDAYPAFHGTGSNRKEALVYDAINGDAVFRGNSARGGVIHD